MHILRLFALSVAGVIGATSVARADAKVEEKVVAPAPNPSVPSYTVSRTGTHFAMLTAKGSRAVVVVDGVEGPPLDQVLSADGNQTLTAVNSVLFSPDGLRHAYMGRIGNELVCIVDGKEMYRGGYTNMSMGFGPLSFSPGGKHVYFVHFEPQATGNSGSKLIMDGKAGPLSSAQAHIVVFSPDDSAWADASRKLDGRDEYICVLNGKEVPYFGYNLRFTSDNHLLSVIGASAKDPMATLMVDGKAVLKASTIGDKIWTSASGGRYAVMAILKAGGERMLVLDGKPVLPMDVEDVAFSPNGKRYIAVGRTPAAAHFAVVDGKKSLEYGAVALPMFSPDSSLALFQASNAGRNFLVVEGEESAPFEYIASIKHAPTFSEKGRHYGYGTFDGMNRNFSLVIDGKQVPIPGRRVEHDSLTFNRDGSHYVVSTLPATRNDDESILLDGVELPGIAAQAFPLTTTEPYALGWFSPDGKHFAYRGIYKNDNTKGGIFIDNKMVFSGVGLQSRLYWSPDSQHLAWVQQDPGAPGEKMVFRAYVDGRPTATYNRETNTLPAMWEFAPDGAFQFLALAMDGSAVKRYRVTPSADTSIETMQSEFEAAQAKVIADAAKAKAAAEAAKVQAQADAAAKAAKAKADADAAAAARKQAREDAVAAKQKAREDAIAAKKAKAQQK